MLICDGVWSDEWFCSLPQRQKLLYLYLLGNCSKCGVFELNMRKINFDLSNGIETIEPFTRGEILSFAGERIKPISDTRAIIVGYIAVNWMRDKPLDPVKNPLHRGISQELAKYGLTFSDVNSMSSKKKLKWIGEYDDAYCNNSDSDTDYIGGQREGMTKTIASKEPRKAAERFHPPSVEDVKAYCEERRNGIDAKAFVAFYESKGWMIGSNKMKSWKAAIITWEKRRESNGTVNLTGVKQCANAFHSETAVNTNLF